MTKWSAEMNPVLTPLRAPNPQGVFVATATPLVEGMGGRRATRVLSKLTARAVYFVNLKNWQSHYDKTLTMTFSFFRIGLAVQQKRSFGLIFNNLVDGNSKFCRQISYSYFVSRGNVGFLALFLCKSTWAAWAQFILSSYLSSRQPTAIDIKLNTFNFCI